MYDATTNKAVGEFGEVVTTTADSDCGANGFLGLYPFKNGNALDQIFSTGTCNTDSDDITGGTGA